MSTTDAATKQDRFNVVDEISQVIDLALTRMDERFNRVEEKLEKQSKDLKQILVRLDSIDKRLEISEQERLVMGHQLKQLGKWVHDLAARIDYKLPA